MQRKLPAVGPDHTGRSGLSGWSSVVEVGQHNWTYVLSVMLLEATANVPLRANEHISPEAREGGHHGLPTDLE